MVPPEERGRLDAERSGFHDAANIRTVFWNYGMVGDYPADPGNVDLSVFHSVEVPKGTGMNYSDGITPFVLAKIRQRNGLESFIMETGFRERQAISPFYNRVMRFEPRPGFFQADPLDQRGPLARDQQRSAHLAGPVAGQAERPRRSRLVGKMERLFRQAAGSRPGKLHRHGRQLL